MGFRRRGESSANRILLDVLQTVHELFFGHDLALVEAAHPDIRLALQDIHLALEAERETAFDKLHGLFKRNFWSRGDQDMKMFRHDDECVQEESSLAAVFEDDPLQEFRVGR